MKHIPVLKDEIVNCFDYLNKSSNGFFVDGTLGEGNHSIAIVERYNNPFDSTQGVPIGAHGEQDAITKIIGIDKDKDALDLAKENIEKSELYDKFILIHDDFKNIKEILHTLCHSEQSEESLILTKSDPSAMPQDDILVKGALLDLGVSSMQLDQKERGFSFTDLNAKLDMRMDQSQKLDAILVLNHYSEDKIEQILREYGEEKFSRGIARNICLIRRNKQVETVGDLVNILEKSIPIKIRKTSRTHFATKVFQAIRIEVNGELSNLERSLRNFVDALVPGGRLAVITFHSLEDRIVKNTFRDLASDCSCPENAPVCNCDKVSMVNLVNKKPITASETEIAENPRSRSAKLRILEKL